MKDFLKVRIGKDIYLLMERITSGWIPLTKKQIKELLDSETGFGANFLVIIEVPSNPKLDLLIKAYNEFGIQVKNNKLIAIIGVYFTNLLNLIPKPIPFTQIIEIDRSTELLTVDMIKKNRLRLNINSNIIKENYLKRVYITNNNWYYYNESSIKTHDDIVLVYCNYTNQFELIQKSLEKNLIKNYILLKQKKDIKSIKKRGNIVLNLDYFGEQNKSPHITLINNLYQLYQIIPEKKYPVQIVSNKNSIIISYNHYNDDQITFYLETNFLILQRGKLFV